MKIEIAKPDLETALTAVRVALGSGTDLSSHYLFRVKDGKAQVNTFDLRVFAGSPLVATLDGAKEGDSFTVEAWRLDQWLGGVGEGVVTLTYEGSGEVQARSKGSRTATRLRSLNPAKWPNNDALLGKASDEGVVLAAPFARAINITRHYVSKDDTQQPELCVLDIKNGIMGASDRKSFASTRLPDLPSLSLRLLGKDIPVLLKFLSIKDFGEAQIKTAERSAAEGGGAQVSFWRADGAYLGMTRPVTDEFPSVTPDRNAELPFYMDLDVAELKSVLALLEAGAPRNQDTATFRFEKDEGSDGTVYVTMPCEAGGTDEYPLTLAKVKEYETVQEPRLNDAGEPILDKSGKPTTISKHSGEAPRGSKWSRAFTIKVQYILGIADVFGLDTLTFGGQDRGRGGHLEFRHSPSKSISGDKQSADPNEYYVALLWRT